MPDPYADDLAVRYARALGAAEGALEIARMMAAVGGCDDLVRYIGEALARVEEMAAAGGSK